MTLDDETSAEVTPVQAQHLGRSLDLITSL